MQRRSLRERLCTLAVELFATYLCESEIKLPGIKRISPAQAVSLKKLQCRLFIICHGHTWPVSILSLMKWLSRLDDGALETIKLKLTGVIVDHIASLCNCFYYTQGVAGYPLFSTLNLSENAFVT